MTITTQQGDTWDKLAKRVYGNELLFDVLLNANIDHRHIAIFNSGVVLEAPEIAESVMYSLDDLPPWKRSAE